MRGRWLLVLLLAACGSKSGVDDGEGSATDGGVACEDYDDTPGIGPAVTVTVRHDGTAPVFHAPNGCGGALTLAVSDAAGQDVPHLLDSECFPKTCQGFIDNAPDCSVGCNDCVGPRAGRIEPGAMVEGSWSGRMLTSLMLSPQCLAGEDEDFPCPDQCVRSDQAPAGTYTIELTVWRSCTGTCECDGGSPPSGSCGLFTGDEQLEEPIVVSATIDFPTQTTVELVITD